MGHKSACLRAYPAVVAAMFFFLLGPLAGCQLQSPVSTTRLIRHQLGIDPYGLAQTATFDAIKASCSPPLMWRVLPLQKTALYTHQQWKSPSGLTGVGVAYIRMPLPLSAKAIIWFAKGEYQKKEKNADGRQLGEWTDALDREWFEAENAKYHVRGCVISRGFEAWIIYSGYKLSEPPHQDELSLAMRSQETILPLPPNQIPQSGMTSANAN